jgi:hypothetical protein
MRANRPLVVWSRTESHPVDGLRSLSVETNYAWRLTGGCPFDLQPPQEDSRWKFVMVIPEGFPLTGGVECRVPGCKRYNVGQASHAHITTGWVVIRTDDVGD